MSDKHAKNYEGGRWIAYLREKGFPLEEYHRKATDFDRWKYLARWHERLRREWPDRAPCVKWSRTS